MNHRRKADNRTLTYFSIDQYYLSNDTNVLVFELEYLFFICK